MKIPRCAASLRDAQPSLGIDICLLGKFVYPAFAGHPEAKRGIFKNGLRFL